MALSAESGRPATRAIAIAGMCLAIAAVERLRAKNVLIDSDLYKIFEDTLGNIDTVLEPSDPAAQEARKLIALIHQATIKQPRD